MVRKAQTLGKGQGGMEYLLLVGVAILVIAIVIIALTSITGQGKNDFISGESSVFDLLNNLSAESRNVFLVAQGDPVVVVYDGLVVTTIGDLLTQGKYVSISTLDGITNPQTQILPGDKIIVEAVSAGAEMSLEEVVVYSAPSGCGSNAAGFFGGDGSIGDPYQICSWTQLNNVRNHLSSNFILVDNLSAGTSDYIGVGNNWVPIGEGPRFIGNFNGNSKTISDLVVNKPTAVFVGLFGASQGNISDLGLVNSNVTGYMQVGALVGYQENGVISNCYSTGVVNGVSIPKGVSVNTGGLVGSSVRGTISNSYSTVTVNGVTVVGGLVGSQLFSTITKSYASGSVRGKEYVGGFAGDAQGIVSNCYATGYVKASMEGAGGLVGTSKATVSNCYSTGLVGYARKNVGGLIGQKYGGSVTNSYYDTITSGQSDVGKGELKSTLQLKTQSTFVGWDFVNTWTINNNYPTLKVGSVVTVPGVPTSVVAVAGDKNATVSFVAPVSNGGSVITGYTVTSSPGNFTKTGTSSPLVVTGLANGTSYTFTVVATNAIGNSSPSSASNSVTPSSGKNYYVSSINANRSDSNPGTSPTAPWATMDKVKAMWGSLSAGDTVHMEKGSVWNLTFSTDYWYMSKGGSALGGQITLRGDDYGTGAKPILKRISGTGNAAMVLVQTSYVTLKDFEIDGGNKGTSGVILAGWSGKNESNINVLDLYVHNLGGDSASYICGIWIAGSEGTTFSDSLIQGNYVADYSAHGLNHYMAGDMINVIWRNNIVDNNFAGGRYPGANSALQIVSGSTNCIFENNFLRDRTSTEGTILAFSKYGNNDGSTNIIRNNIFADSFKYGILFTFDSGGNGTTRNEKLTYDIFNNIFYNSTMAGIAIYPTTSYGPGSKFNIYNNTFYNGGANEITLNNDDGDTNVNLYNNIFYATGTGPALNIGSTFAGPINHGNNLFWHSSGLTSKVAVYNKTGNVTIANVKTSFETTAQNTNPNFTNTVQLPTSTNSLIGVSPNGLKPLTGSNAINKGTTGIYTKDINGTTRPQNSIWDIGAYEAG
ncbi:MAG: GLUG motif-containing protein [archaeon]|jgi:hypothetical protein